MVSFDKQMRFLATERLDKIKSAKINKLLRQGWTPLQISKFLIKTK